MDSSELFFGQYIILCVFKIHQFWNPLFLVFHSCVKLSTFRTFFCKIVKFILALVTNLDISDLSYFI